MCAAADRGERDQELAPNGERAEACRRLSGNRWLVQIKSRDLRDAISPGSAIG